MSDLINIDWVEIPAGQFIYGEFSNMEIRMIEEDYLIARVPITYAQYQVFLSCNPNQPAPEDWDAELRTYKGKYENHPVVHVTYGDAESFCEWAGCRLPSEEEWEKAARGDNGNIYPWGDEITPAHANYNHKGIIRFGTTPVDRYAEFASPYGVLDMAGNVYEWTTGWYNSEKILRVGRGGYWANGEYHIRTTFRKNLHPEFSSPAVGFRPVKSP